MSDQRMEGQGNQVSNGPQDHVNESDDFESLRTCHQRTWAELADMHLAYGAAHGNSREARRLYGERHPERHLPYHSSFADIARRLRETGSFARRGGGGRPRSVRTPTFEEDVLRRVAGNQSASTRGIAHAMEKVGCQMDEWGAKIYWKILKAMDTEKTKKLPLLYSIISTFRSNDKKYILLGQVLK